jgi:hypothetical protein
MAIKVKHEGSVASRIAANADGGRAKRAMNAAAFAKGRDIQQKQAATAHASAPSGGSAPLISAPTGAAHAPTMSGGGGIGSVASLGGGRRVGTTGATRVSSGVGGSADERLKVTGSSIFDRPDDASVWDPATSQWKRKYLPGEYEAEAKERIGRVENDLYADRALTAQGQKERAALVNDITTAIRNGKFSKEEQAQLMKEYGIADENIRMADALRDRDPTPEEQFRKNTFTDANGVVFSPDGKMLYNPMDAEAKREDMRLRREEVTQARNDANEMKRVTMMQKFIADLEKPVSVTEMVDGAAEDQNGDKIPGPVKMTRFLTEDEKNAAVQRYMSSLSQFGQTQGNGAAEPQAQAATVPGFTPVSGDTSNDQQPQAQGAPPIDGIQDMYGRWRSAMPQIQKQVFQRETQPQAQGAPADMERFKKYRVK